MVWPLNRRFKDGKLLTPPLLGYDRPKDVTGRYIKYAPLEINKAEARIVNFIYDAYLIGWSKERIANFLTEIGCQTKTGGFLRIENSICAASWLFSASRWKTMKIPAR